MSIADWSEKFETGIEEIDLGVRATMTVEVHMEDGGKPACIAEMITVVVPA